MDDFYVQQLARTGAEEVWRRSPVAFESCWDMRKWEEEGWDIDAIFDYALRCHASYVNNKSAPIPGGTRDQIERFLARLGYRLILRSVEHDASVYAGSETILSLRWENAGVAPPYRDDRVAVRLRRVDGTPGESRVIVSEESVRGRLPGKWTTELTVKVPRDCAAGRYELAIGVVDSRSHQPVVRLAITGRDSEGWNPVGELRVLISARSAARQPAGTRP